MILFHSNFCEHCKQLIEAIKRHDMNNTIKHVSIDVLRNQGYEFEHKIHSVPALFLEDTKEIIYGKEVFDYLLLPNRGKLLINRKERDPNISKQDNNFEREPLGFTLGNVTSQKFENINEEKDNKDDINFSWMSLDKNVLSENTGIIDKVPNSDENDKKIPSIESILAEREKALKV
jgi:hypothetical protein